MNKILTEMMQTKARELGKRETMTIEEGGKKYYLAGTCLAYEDELCDKVRDQDDCAEKKRLFINFDGI